MIHLLDGDQHPRRLTSASANRSQPLKERDESQVARPVNNLGSSLPNIVINIILCFRDA
jgi:hypothetical protein